MADANSPLPGLLDSLGQFADLGVPASKVTMGVGWYGYDYWCYSNVSGTPCHARIGAKQVSNSACTFIYFIFLMRTVFFWFLLFFCDADHAHALQPGCASDRIP